jgi:hypothetical protein
MIHHLYFIIMYSFLYVKSVSLDSFRFSPYYEKNLKHRYN